MSNFMASINWSQCVVTGNVNALIFLISKMAENHYLMRRN